MSDDILTDPEFLAWAKGVQEDLVPKLQDSALCVSLVPNGPTDVKFAVELGMSIMLDKPILALVQAGTKVPERLVRVADRIVEYDPDNMAGAAAAIQQALADLT